MFTKINENLKNRETQCVLNEICSFCAGNIREGCVFLLIALRLSHSVLAEQPGLGLLAGDAVIL